MEQVTIRVVQNVEEVTIKVFQGVASSIPQGLEDRILELEGQTIALLEDTDTLDGGYIY
tara:strand:- start:398 stop:574 length:177 start_codon:yes stop_codon:yes gene_type:complete